MKNSFRLFAVALSQVVILNWGGQPDIPVERKAKKAVDQAEEAFNAPEVKEDENETIVKQEKSPAKGFGN
jgi:hypothetical protein